MRTKLETLISLPPQPISITDLQVGTETPPPSEKREPITLDARVDGKRITIEGEDEVVISCGSASITLRRNGRVIIRGSYIETRAKGTNRIKGGMVLIN